MGKHHAHQDCFNAHALAAVIDNHSRCIENETDYLYQLMYYLYMANAINKYADNNLIKNDAAAEYWLEVFLWCAPKFINFQKL